MIYIFQTNVIIDAHLDVWVAYNLGAPKKICTRAGEHTTSGCETRTFHITTFASPNRSINSIISEPGPNFVIPFSVFDFFILSISLSPSLNGIIYHHVCLSMSRVNLALEIDQISPRKHNSVIIYFSMQRTHHTALLTTSSVQLTMDSSIASTTSAPTTNTSSAKDTLSQPERPRPAEPLPFEVKPDDSDDAADTPTAAYDDDEEVVVVAAVTINHHPSESNNMPVEEDSNAVVDGIKDQATAAANEVQDSIMKITIDKQSQALGLSVIGGTDTLLV